jgi:hypothetical protein
MRRYVSRSAASPVCMVKPALVEPQFPTVEYVTYRSIRCGDDTDEYARSYMAGVTLSPVSTQ